MMMGGAQNDGYEEIGSLRSTGLQRIDTQCYIDFTNAEAVIEVVYAMEENITNQHWIWGTRGTGGMGFGENIPSVGKPSMYVYNTLIGDWEKGQIRQTVAANMWYKDTIHYSSLSRYIVRENIVTGATATSTFTGDGTDFSETPLHLFARGPAFYYPFRGSIRSFKATVGGVELINLIARKRASDNKLGMLDIKGSICPLTNTPFFINSQSGADFIEGSFI